MVINRRSERVLQTGGMARGGQRAAFDASEMTICGMSAALICAGAFIRITIPAEPLSMHFTLQWFFVLMAALLFGKRLGTASTAVYLLLGLCGMPVFASGGGLSYVLRPTFGFLLGFLPAAWITGCVLETGARATFRRMVSAGVCGLLVYYAVGMLYYAIVGSFLYHYTGLLRVILINCCFLTIGGDFLLCILAAAAAQRVRRCLPIRRSGQHRT